MKVLLEQPEISLGPIKVTHYAKFEALHIRLLPMAYFQSNSSSLSRDYLLQKAGDIVSTAGRPGKGIGICSNVSCHKFCCFMTFRPTSISNSIMVHTKTVLTRKKHKKHKRNKKKIKQTNPNTSFISLIDQVLVLSTHAFQNNRLDPLRKYRIKVKVTME